MTTRKNGSDQPLFRQGYDLKNRLVEADADGDADADLRLGGGPGIATGQRGADEVKTLVNWNLRRIGIANQMIEDMAWFAALAGVL